MFKKKIKTKRINKNKTDLTDDKNKNSTKVFQFRRSHRINPLFTFDCCLPKIGKNKENIRCYIVHVEKFLI